MPCKVERIALAPSGFRCCRIKTKDWIAVSRQQDDTRADCRFLKGPETSWLQTATAKGHPQTQLRLDRTRGGVRKFERIVVEYFVCHHSGRKNRDGGVVFIIEIIIFYFQ